MSELGSQPEGFRSGFVCIVGRPNVGKSTLLNQVLRKKIAITSDRPQTTRNAIRGIHTTPTFQLVFVDTPGLHKPHSALGTRLNRVVRNTLEEVDVAVFLIDVSKGMGGGDEFIARELLESSRPVIAVLNKIDVAKPAKIADANERLRTMAPDWPILGLSARTGAGIVELLDEIISRLPEGPMLYPPDEVTDQPQRQSVSELIREKVLELTREEVPHSVAVVVDEMDRDDDGLMQVQATIYVERSSQKGIVIGRAGAMLREIGTRARKDIETLLGEHVYLGLHVKVARDWQREDSSVERFGYGR